MIFVGRGFNDIVSRFGTRGTNAVGPSFDDVSMVDQVGVRIPPPTRTTPMTEPRTPLKATQTRLRIARI